MHKKKLAIIFTSVAAALFFSGPMIFDDKDVALQAVKNDKNFMDINIGSYAPFGCGRGFYFANSFTAKDNGREVSGVVCRTLLTNISDVRMSP